MLSRTSESEHHTPPNAPKFSPETSRFVPEENAIDVSLKAGYGATEKDSEKDSKNTASSVENENTDGTVEDVIVNNSEKIDADQVAPSKRLGNC